MKEFQQHYRALKCDIILNLFWLDLLDFPNVMETDVSLYKAHTILESCTMSLPSIALPARVITLVSQPALV